MAVKQGGHRKLFAHVADDIVTCLGDAGFVIDRHPEVPSFEAKAWTFSAPRRRPGLTSSTGAGSEAAGAYVYSNFFLSFKLDNFWQTLRGPFSAVSKPVFASEY